MRRFRYAMFASCDAGADMRRAVLSVFAIVSGCGAALFGYAWYDRYWLWRDCFNELGRCYDPESQQVFLEQAGPVWGMFAGACLLAALFFARRAARR
jgi:hypothetical protein